MWLIMLNGQCIGMVSYWEDAALIEETYANGGDEVELKFINELATIQ